MDIGHLIIYLNIVLNFYKDETTIQIRKVRKQIILNVDGTHPILRDVQRTERKNALLSTFKFGHWSSPVFRLRLNILYLFF